MGPRLHPSDTNLGVNGRVNHGSDPKESATRLLLRLPLVFIPNDRDVRKPLRDENMENTVGHKV